METDHKQRGFMRNKLAKTFSRVISPVTKRSRPLQCSSNKVRPTQLSNGIGSVSYLTHQDLSTPSSMQRAVSTSTKLNSLREQSGYVNNGPYSGGGDENVDLKAAKYILSVQERFNEERVITNASHHQPINAK